MVCQLFFPFPNYLSDFSFFSFSFSGSFSFCNKHSFGFDFDQSQYHFWIQLNFSAVKCLPKGQTRRLGPESIFTPDVWDTLGCRCESCKYQIRGSKSRWWAILCCCGISVFNHAGLATWLAGEVDGAITAGDAMGNSESIWLANNEWLNHISLCVLVENLL